MDATENDIPPQAPFRVQGFPTLKFRPAGTSEFLEYSGDRSLESLLEYVEVHRKSAGGEVAGDEADEEFEEDEEVPEHDGVVNVAGFGESLDRATIHVADIIVYSYLQ